MSKPDLDKAIKYMESFKFMVKAMNDDVKFADAVCSKNPNAKEFGCPGDCDTCVWPEDGEQHFDELFQQLKLIQLLEE